MERHFEFELYRLNVVDLERLLFDLDRPTISGDADIMRVLENATNPAFRSVVEGRRTVYEWVLREYRDESTDEGGRRVISMTLARSMVIRTGDIVTDDGIESGFSEFDPPLAEKLRIFFDTTRHLVAVERFSTVTATNRWHKVIEDILEQSARALGYHSRIELEPVPKLEEIQNAFRSFTRLTRMRVRLRLPNPELSRYAEHLYNDMRNGGVKEFLQDMRNPAGMSQEEGHLPHAAAEIAQAGYKKGHVKFEGLRRGRHEVVETGGKAARGQIPELRDFVRGINSNTRTQEGRRVTTAILEEIDRIAPSDGHGHESR